MNPSTGMLQRKPTGLFAKIATLKPWQQIAIAVGTAMILFCMGVAAESNAADNETPAIAPIPTTASASDGASPEPTAVQPLPLNGSGNNVVSVGAVLNGTFRVDYSSGYDFLVVRFLKADGTDGMATFDMGINEYGDGGVTGSRILHFEDVTMVEVSNTQGDWSLIFTPV